MRPFGKGLLALLVTLSPLAIPIASGNASASPGFSVTLKLADGTFTFKSRPKAIVSLSPTATEMLYAIGAGPQVKAVDSYSDYPTNAPKTTLNGYQPNVEAIAKYKPDLVVVASDSTGFNTQMAALKIPVIYDPAASNLAQAYAQYGDLGAATGHASQAKKEVSSIKSKIAQIVATTPHAKKGATYYYELEPDYYSVTSSTFVGKLFGLLGLKSIADSATGVAASGGYPQLSAEFILKSNPTYIFLADTICCKATATTVAARSGWSSLSAVKDHRIVPLSDDIASRWGPRITVLLQDVANALEGKHVSATS
ncbi:MAG TPA: ABC transporter substrate-binding protein [Acidimicrobiales bacterium]|jgi:iron complex transport system substrate-binding protein|nr:ABC transporter substrate-binding protein [Acidimicrobiales bacterium]